ncbi:MAG: ABC transporter ATP-binding protein [Halobacteriovoraceae bacterium]|nr:ABC transporter ATP-binding protein [Halobacteriovoraceae bacterium]|tara:strand:- start:23483 stop:25318 length:1836 start_codon:yes stop_codon:yes gene_type:complete
MIQVSKISKQFAGQVLFKDLSFNIGPGERVGLVGRNGSGKSTLFSLILGKQTPDEGEVQIPKGYRIGQLEQHIKFSEPTVLKECCLALGEEEKYDFHKAEKILSGLGFEEEDFSKRPESFSGGWQIRINLCKALLSNPNLLLLDEPTNYLDILSLRWLRSFLKSFPGEVVIITHDREFMDSVTTHTMGIYRKRLKKIKGATSKFYEQMEMEEEIHEKTRLNQEKKKEHLESFIERFGAKASKASQAQSKVKQLEKMETLDKLEGQASMGLRFNYRPCPGKELVRISDLSFGYPGGELLFKNLNFTIGAQDRIGIIGKNGKGKSTLLNVLAKELNPVSGVMKEHPSLAVGHFGQTNVIKLSPENTVAEEVGLANNDLSPTQVRSICGSLMFEGESADKKIKVLSGGEKNRVLLGTIVANASNLLLLDEPTNHLDMESIEILTEEVANYPGAVALVTHSEELLRKTVNRLIVFNKDGAQLFQGGYDEFLEKIGWEEEVDTKEASVKPKLNKKELHARRQVIIKERAKICRPLEDEKERLEEEIMSFEEELSDWQTKLELATEAQESDKVLESSQKVGELENKVQNNFTRMEEIEEQILSHATFYENELEKLEK